MRICQIITRLIVGGAQENTLLTCEGLHARGHEVLLLAGPECGLEGSLWTRARASGYTVEQVGSLVRAVRPVTDWRCSRELTHRIRRFAPLVVHTHSSKAGVLGRWAGRRAGVPVIVHTIHGMSFNRTQSQPVRCVYRIVERACGRWTDRVVTVADAMTEQAVAAGLGPRERFLTVYSGIEVETFDARRFSRAAVRERWGVPPDAVVVGTVARLQANKGYEQLIGIVRRVVRKDPALRFVWVGSGSLREVLEDRITRAGLRSHVYLTGLVAPESVPEQLAGMDVLVHLSRWEGLPRAMVQASLMGVAVVGYDIDGAREAVISGRTGELVGLDDTASIERCILELAADGEKRRRYGQAGREKCEAQFDHQVMVDRLDRLYQTLAGEPEKAGIQAGSDEARSRRTHRTL